VVVNDAHKELFASMSPNINVEVARRGEAKTHIQELVDERNDQAVIAFDFEHYSNNRPQLSQTDSNGKTTTTVHDLFAPAIHLYNNETDGEKRYTHFIEDMLSLHRDSIVPSGARFTVALPINNEQIYRGVANKYGIDRNREQVGIVVEASLDEKRYPLDKWLEVINMLATEKPGAEFSMIYNESSGNPRFSRTAMESSLSALPVHIRRKVHLIPGSIEEIVSVISHQTLLLSNDTGFAHIAAHLAHGPKVITLHVPRFDPKLWVSNSQHQRGITAENNDISSINPATIVAATR